MIVVRVRPGRSAVACRTLGIDGRGTWVARQDRLSDGSFFSSKRLRRPDQRRRRTGSTLGRRTPTVPWGRHDNLWIWEATDAKDVEVQTTDLKRRLPCSYSRSASFRQMGR
jgi:hypothetical protein